MSGAVIGCETSLCVCLRGEASPEVLHTLPSIVELCFSKHLWGVPAVIQGRWKI